MNNDIVYTLRIDEDLYEKLRIVAAENSRSINKEIEHIIKIHVENFWKEKEREKEPVKQ